MPIVSYVHFCSNLLEGINPKEMNIEVIYDNIAIRVVSEVDQVAVYSYGFVCEILSDFPLSDFTICQEQLESTVVSSKRN